MIWLTSDWHFGHKNIRKFCPDSRGHFTTLEAMNMGIVHAAYDAGVGDSDILIVLGDIVMGDKEDSMRYVEMMPGGIRILMPGNHDGIFAEESEARRKRFRPLYENAFDAIIERSHPQYYLWHADTRLTMSHFPYDGDSHDGDRWTDYRLEDDGTILLHGHTHSTEKISRSAKGTLQIHVGVDAWDMKPVSLAQIGELIEENS